MTLNEEIERMIDKLERKAETDPELKAELFGISKRVAIDLGSEQYSFILDEGKISSYSMDLIDSPDITIISDPETISGLIAGRIRPMKALALRKLRVKGDMEDLLRFRRFL